MMTHIKEMSVVCVGFSAITDEIHKKMLLFVCEA